MPIELIFISTTGVRVYDLTTILGLYINVSIDLRTDFTICDVLSLLRTWHHPEEEVVAGGKFPQLTRTIFSHTSSIKAMLYRIFDIIRFVCFSVLREDPPSTIIGLLVIDSILIRGFDITLREIEIPLTAEGCRADRNPIELVVTTTIFCHFFFDRHTQEHTYGLERVVFRISSIEVVIFQPQAERRGFCAILELILQWTPLRDTGQFVVHL